MAAASEGESKSVAGRDVTSCDPGKPEVHQGQAPASSGGSLVDKNPFLIFFLKEATEMTRETGFNLCLFVCLF